MPSQTLRVCGRLLGLACVVGMVTAAHAEAQALASTTEGVGRVWDETEVGWTGVWTRRGESNVFDGVWTLGAGQVTAELTIAIQGSTVSVVRRRSSDGSECEYNGVLAADGKTVTGTFRCSRSTDQFPWRATIRPTVPASAGGRAFTAQPRASEAIASQPSFSWVGQDEDRVGAGGNGRPDGGKDGHFRLVLPLPALTAIQSIAVYSSDAAGTPQGGQVWHSQTGHFWVLGVVHDGKQLNQGHVPTLGSFSGPTTFDLYGSDSGWFRKGNSFMVEVVFSSGQKLNKVVQLGE